jgi:serine protease
MRYCKVNWALRALAIIFTVSSLSALAADYSRSSIIPQKSSPAVSNRLIVKYKPARQTSVLSAAQVATELRRPLSAETLNQLQAAAGISLTESHAISNGAHVLILQGSPDKQTIDQAISNIRGLSDVEYVEEDRVLTTQSVPNDASYGNLWGLQAVSPVVSPSSGSTGSYGANFESAWNTNTGTSSSTGFAVVVAVVDTGITPHADIVGSGGTVSPTATGNLVSPGYDFITDCRIRGSCAANTINSYVAPSANATDLGDYISAADITANPTLFPGPNPSNSLWHGTHVSGTIAALGNNSVGVIGGAYSARILPVRVLGKGGGYVSDIAEGILWAAGAHPTIVNPNPARVINLSLGGTGACSATEQNAINAAVAAGAVIVVAAGNDHADVANHSPANCNNVITVAAIGRDGLRAAYSNFSSPASNTTNPVHITLAAQGGDQSLTGFDPGILSTVNTGTTTPLADCTTTPIPTCYAYYQGTSMATPHVAAAVALMLARNPALTPAQIKTILSLSVTAFPASNVWALYDCATLKNCGTGILNAQFAVQNSVLPYSTATAFAATRSSGGGSGGCSIMPAGGNPDISLLFSMLALLAYSFRQRISLSLGQN